VLLKLYKVRSVVNDIFSTIVYFRHLDLLPVSRIFFERARLHCDSCASCKILMKKITYETHCKVYNSRRADHTENTIPLRLDPYC
jgi:hypothetical protein